MQDWQKRVIEERNELREKLSSLAAYIGNDEFDSLDGLSKELLVEQLVCIGKYISILDKRISIIQDECLAKMIDKARNDVQDGNVMSAEQAIDALKRARDGR